MLKSKWKDWTSTFAGWSFLPSGSGQFCLKCVKLWLKTTVYSKLFLHWFAFAYSPSNCQRGSLPNSLLVTPAAAFLVKHFGKKFDCKLQHLFQSPFLRCSNHQGDGHPAPPFPSGAVLHPSPFNNPFLCNVYFCLCGFVSHAQTSLELDHFPLFSGWCVWVLKQSNKQRCTYHFFFTI